LGKQVLDSYKIVGELLKLLTENDFLTPSFDELCLALCYF